MRYLGTALISALALAAASPADAGNPTREAFQERKKAEVERRQEPEPAPRPERAAPEKPDRSVPTREPWLEKADAASAAALAERRRQAELERAISAGTVHSPLPVTAADALKTALTPSELNAGENEWVAAMTQERLKQQAAEQAARTAALKAASQERQREAAAAAARREAADLAARQAEAAKAQAEREAREAAAELEAAKAEAEAAVARFTDRLPSLSSALNRPSEPTFSDPELDRAREDFSESVSSVREGSWGGGDPDGGLEAARSGAEAAVESFESFGESLSE